MQRKVLVIQPIPVMLTQVEHIYLACINISLFVQKYKLIKT